MNASPQDFALAQDLRARYERDGFVFPLRVLPRSEAVACRAALEEAEALAQDRDARSLIHGYAHMVVPRIDDLVRDPRILDPVSAILGPDLLLWAANFFIKEPNTSDYVSWHQDLNYWGLDGEHEVTAWLALSDATRESGAMRFIPGSHRSRVEHEDTFAKANLLSRGQEIAVEVDESVAADIVLEAGEMSLHHGLMFHSSAPNRSTDRRIGLALRYIRPEMRQVAGTHDYACLVRGADPYEHFQQTARPTRCLDPA
ncbi:MAG: phytanoyl-CoA dioxygenase family protein, partial [Gammaproteobacteria bacterium]